MDARSWVSVFQRIPPEKENLLVIVTNTGVEIIIQKVVRVESEFVIVKGRISGATDAARAVLLPYAQISNLAINRQLLESDILAVFGLIEGGVPRRTTTSEAPAAEPMEEVAEVAPLPASSPVIPSAAPSAPVRGQPSKSIFLQRLRERLGGDAKVDRV